MRDSQADRPDLRRRGFVQAELLTVLVILGIVSALLAVTFPDSRRRAQLAGSVTNLQRQGAGAADFAIDNADLFATFTWRAGFTYTCESQYTFPRATFDVDAAANQAVCIMRHVAGRTDITRIGPGWLPHLSYSQLVLMEYLGEPLPSTLMISPADRSRLLWRRAVLENPTDPNTPFFALACRPPGTENHVKRWPFSSSYESQPSFCSPDRAEGAAPTISQGPNHTTFNAGNAATRLGQRRLSEVRFPSQKAMMYESVQRFFGQRELFFAYTESRVPVLLADGSVSVRSIDEANDGFDPNSPNSQNPTRLYYLPNTAYEPPPRNGQDGEYTNGVIRWTQLGLLGRDFGGPEVF